MALSAAADSPHLRCTSEDNLPTSAEGQTRLFETDPLTSALTPETSYIAAAHQINRYRCVQRQLHNDGLKPVLPIKVGA